MSVTLYDYLKQHGQQKGPDNVANDPYNIIQQNGPEDDGYASGAFIRYSSLHDFSQDTDKYSYWGVEDINFVLQELEADDGFRYMYNIKIDDDVDGYYLKQAYYFAMHIEVYLEHHSDPETLKSLDSWPDNHIKLLKKLKSTTTIAGENSAGKTGVNYGEQKWLFHLTAASLGYSFSHDIRNRLDTIRSVHRGCPDDCQISRHADKLERMVDTILRAWERDRGVGDIAELQDQGKLGSEEEFMKLVLETADTFVKEGMKYHSGWLRDPIKYEKDGKTFSYPIKRYQSFLYDEKVPLLDVFEDILYNFVKVSPRRGENTYNLDIPQGLRKGQEGLILHLHYSTYKMRGSLPKKDYGPGVHNMSSKGFYGHDGSGGSRGYDVALVLKKTMEVPSGQYLYFTQKIENVLLKQDQGIGGRSFEGLQSYYEEQLEPTPNGSLIAYNPTKILTRQRHRLSQNWDSVNEGLIPFVLNSRQTHEAQANEIYNNRNPGSEVGAGVYPINVAQNAWKSFGRDVNLKLNDFPKFQGRFGDDMTFTTLRQIYATTAAEVIAMQFLLHSYSLESREFWLSLPELYSFDKDIYLTDEEAEKFGAAARDYDGQIYDEAAGDEANLAELSNEDIRERQLFLKQCALLMNMQQLKHAYQKEFFKSKEPNSYYNEIYTLDVNDSDTRTQLVNRLIAPQQENIDLFMGASPELQASLTPKLRFYRVFNEINDKNKLKEVEIVFPKHYDPDNSKYNLPTDASIFRGGGVGIKDFSWSFEGTTPATARNDIKASLTMYFQDFAELLKKRSSNKIFGDSNSSESFRYIELLLLPGTSLKDQEEENISPQDRAHMLNYDPSNHRIRVDVGWEISGTDIFKRLAESRVLSKEEQKDDRFNIAKVLSLMNKSYYLNMVEHDIDFKEDGSVEVKVDYRAYLESAGKSITLDALTTIALAKQKQTLKEEYELIIKTGICKDNRKKYEELISIYNALDMKIIKKTHQSIIERLVKNKRLHYCTIDNDSVNVFAKNGFFINAPDLTMPSKIPLSETQVENAVKQKVETNKDGEEEKKDAILDADLLRMSSIDHPANNQQVITFFYVGDLIHTILDCMRDPKSPTYERYSHLKNTKILLSSFDYRDQQNDLVHINLSEIPISTEYFFEWMNQNVIKPKRKSYPITYFIRDICNKLIVDLMLEVCINKDQVKTMRFNSMNFLALGDVNSENGDVTDPFRKMNRIKDTIHIDVTEAYEDLKLPLKSDISDKSIDKAFNYFLFYPVTQVQHHEGIGDLSDDGNSGVYHFSVGGPGGILKRMKFDKTDIQYIREARFFNHGHDGLMQLSAVYKVTLELFGNTLFYPGMQIYINPTFMGGEDFDPTVPGSVANSLGFGGYHLITRVESSIGPGKFNTTVQAQFVYSGDGVTGVYNNKNKATNNPEKIKQKAAEARRLTNIDDNACTALTYIREKSYYNLDNLDTNLAKINEPILKDMARNLANEGTPVEDEDE